MYVNDTLIRMEFYNAPTKEWRQMGILHYDTYPQARKEFDRCNKAYPEYCQRFMDNQTNEIIVFFIGNDPNRRPLIE